MDTGSTPGDIALQEAFALPEGCSGAEAERRTAMIGGRLMVAALHALGDGTLARQPSRPAEATSQRRDGTIGASARTGLRGGRSTSCAHG